MNGMELDRRMREILINVTKETSLSATAALTELGFGPRVSFEMVEKILQAKAEGKDR